MHPILFHVGDFYVGTYGLMIVLGLVAALTVGTKLGKSDGLETDFYYDFAFLLVLSGFIGARILFILVNFGAFLEAPLSLILAREGFVFAGGFVLATIVGLVYVRKKGIPLWRTADVAAPCLAIAHGFGRIGCFLAGCCYGRVCPEDSPFGVSFPRIIDEQGQTRLSFAYHEHVGRGIIPESAMQSAPVIPTQLIESAANFAIFGVLLLLWKRRAFPGQLFVIYLLLYGPARFSIEFLRGDLERGLWLGGSLSTSQIFSVGITAAGIVLWFYLKPAPAVRRPAAQIK